MQIDSVRTMQLIERIRSWLQRHAHERSPKATWWDAVLQRYPTNFRRLTPDWIRSFVVAEPLRLTTASAATAVAASLHPPRHHRSGRHVRHPKANGRAIWKIGPTPRARRALPMSRRMSLTDLNRTLYLPWKRDRW